MSKNFSGYSGFTPVQDGDVDYVFDSSKALKLKNVRFEEVESEAAPEQGGSLTKDLLVSWGVGSNQLLKSVGSAYGLISGDMDNWAVNQGESGVEYYQGKKSDELLALEADRRHAIESADGEIAKFGTAIWETVKDPRLLSSFLVEQMPMTVGAGAAGRALGTTAKALGASEGFAVGVGSTGSVVSGGGLQGGDVGGEAYESIMSLPEEIWAANDEYKALAETMAPEDAKHEIALKYGRAAGAVGAATSLIAQTVIPNASRSDDILGGGIDAFGSGFKQIGKSAIGEGSQEIIEEGGGKLIGNTAIHQVDPDQSITEGVGEASGLGLVGGAVMGGGTEAIGAIGGNARSGYLPDSQERIEPTIGDQEINPPMDGQDTDLVVDGQEQIDTQDSGIPLSELDVQDSDDNEDTSVTIDKLDPAPMIEGAEGKIYTPDMKEVPIKFALMDAESLSPATDKADNQARDRSSAASQAQITSIASNPVYGKLNDSPEMDTGSPTVTVNGEVIGGNGRVLGLKQSYATGQAESYRSELMADLQNKGIDPELAASMNSPVLVRVLPEDSNVREMALASNEGGSAQLSGREQSSVDGERIGFLDDLVVSDEGAVDVNSASNREFVRRVINEMPQKEQARFLGNDGRLSQEGDRRIRNAILSMAYGDTETLGRLVESNDGDMMNIAKALTDAAPVVAKAKAQIAQGALHDVDISENIADAVELLASIKADSNTVDQFLAQGDMVSGSVSPEIQELLKFFESNARSAKKMSGAIRGFYDSLASRGNPNQSGLFGESVAPTKQELLSEQITGSEQEGSTQQAKQEDDGATSEGGKDSQEESLESENAGRSSSQELDGQNFELQTQSEEDLAEKSERENDTEAQEKADAKAQVDNEADHFDLSGSTTPNTSISATNDATQKPQGGDMFTSTRGDTKPKAEPKTKEIPLLEGDKFYTTTGRETTPYPRTNYKIPSKNLANERRWLKENAIEEANSRGDKFNSHQFESLDIKNWSPADGDLVNLYLFDDAEGRIGSRKVTDESSAPANTSEQEDFIATTRKPQGITKPLTESKEDLIESYSKKYKDLPASLFIDLFSGEKSQTSSYDSSDLPSHISGQLAVIAKRRKNSVLTFGGKLSDKTIASLDAMKAVKEEVAEEPEHNLNLDSKTKVTDNKIFTEDAAEKARALLKSKLGNLNSGIDPEVMQAGITLAGYHIEKGARTFSAFAEAMLSDLGDVAKPYLKSWYMGVKYDPRAAEFDGMDNAASVDEVDVDSIGKPEASSEVRQEEASLSSYLYSKLETIKNNRDLKKAIADHKGVTVQDVDSELLKEGQEAMEVALVRQARDTMREGFSQSLTEDKVFEKLTDQYKNQPNLDVRSSTSMENQAYSTPAPLAMIASQLAGIDAAASKVYEPTAGNGMLLIGAGQDLATVNELNDGRIEGLKELGYKPTQNDAIEVQPKAKSQDAVIMNPPFGSLPKKVKVDGYNIKKIDHLIAAKSLESMKDNGRSVMIIGASKKAGVIGAGDAVFFSWLYSNYNVVDHFEADGKLYSRQGASWPVRVITINGRAESDSLSPPSGSIPRYKEWNEIYEHYNGVVDSEEWGSVGRVESDSVNENQTKGGDPLSGFDGGEGGKAVQSSELAGNKASSKSDAGSNESDNGGERADRDRGNSGNRGKSSEPDQSGGTTGNDQNAQSIENKSDGKGSENAGKSDTSNGGKQGSLEEDANLGSDFQAKYSPKSEGFNDNVLTPVNMRSAIEKALDKLQKAVGNVDEYVMKKLGYKSKEDLYKAYMGLQVDTIAAAIYNMEERGKGVIIADQTGVGKGRQAAGVIKYALETGKIPIFVTVKPNLFSDMYEELQAVGVATPKPFITGASEGIVSEGELIFKNTPAKNKKIVESITEAGDVNGNFDMIFTTYDQMKGEFTGVGKNRKYNPRREMIKALVNSGRAVMVFDESHNAAGDPVSIGVGLDGDKTELQTAAGFYSEVSKKAQAIYLSATFAKSPENLPFYHKTDLVDAVDSFEELVDAMNFGGVPMQQIISAMLANSGQLFRRERSFEGISIPVVVDKRETEKQVIISDKVTEALGEVIQSSNLFKDFWFENYAQDYLQAKGISVKVAGNRIKGADVHPFTSVVHNYISQMLLGLKVDGVVADAVELHKNGRKPVIALENTMGSFLKEYAEVNGLKDGDKVDLTYNDILLRALERSRRISITNKQGDSEPHQVELSDLDHTTERAYRDAEELIKSLDLSAIPASPLDYIMDGMRDGGVSVDEITGRKWRIDYREDVPTLRAIKKRSSSERKVLIDSFNDDDLSGLVLNVAGATGMSIHASEKFKSQKPRHMIVAQAMKDINILVQMLGRINRTGQVALPEYTIKVLDLPTEKRPAAVTMRKMAKLNANTSANDKSDNTFDAPDYLNKYGDLIVNRYLLENPDLSRAIGVNPSEANKDGEEVQPEVDFASKVSGRMALLPVDVHNQVQADILEAYTDLIAYLDATNQNDLVASVQDLDAYILDSKVVHEGKDKSNSFTGDTTLHKVNARYQGKTPTPEEVMSAIELTTKKKGVPEKIAEDISVKKAARQKPITEELSKRLSEAAAAANKAERKFDSLEDGSKEKIKAGKEFDAAESKQNSLALRMESSENQARETSRALSKYKVGKVFTLNLGGETVEGVIVDIEDKDNGKGSPYSASKLAIRFKVASGANEVLIRLSQINNSDIVRGEISGDYNDLVPTLFSAEKSATDRREIRYVATGNIIAGMSKLSGRIAIFTDREGNKHEGILMPKSFGRKGEFEEGTASNTFAVRDGKVAAKYLVEQSGTGEAGIFTYDKAIRISRGRSGFTISVPTSNKNATGKSIKFDKGIRAAAGDFYGKGKFQTVVVPESKLAEVIDIVLGKTALFAPSGFRQEWTNAGGQEQSKAVRSFDGENLQKEDEGLAKEVVEPKSPDLIESTRNAKKEPDSIQDAPAADSKEAELYTYTTKKGKELKGVIRHDLTIDQAKEIDPYSWVVKGKGAPFIREKHFAELSKKYPPKPESNYSLSEGNSKGVRVGVVKTAINRLSKSLGVRVHVVKNASDLPESIKAQVSRDGIKDKLRGLFDPATGEVYLVADNLNDAAESVEVFLHEVVGHKGIRAVFGAKLNFALDQIFKSMSMDDRSLLSGKYNGQLKGKSPIESNRIVAEEYIAHLAESDPKNTLLKKVVSAIRNWLRNNVARFNSMAWTEADIVQLIASSKKALKSQSKPNKLKELGLRYQAAFHGTPHSFDKFSLAAMGTGEGAQAYGWGMYFAGKRSVAEWYRDNLRGGLINFEGEALEYSLIDKLRNEAKTKEALALDAVLDSMFAGVRTKSGIVERIEGKIQEAKNKGDEIYADNLGRSLEWLKSNISRLETPNERGNLYQVDIPEDGELLDWDKPLVEQMIALPKIREAIKYVESDIKSVNIQTARGENLYDRIVGTIGRNKDNVEQLASEYLNSLGIKGLRYLDGNSRSGDEGNHNYVIWDEGAVTVEAVNDEQVAADAAAEVVEAAYSLGYKGDDHAEAMEWIRAKEKGLDMSHEARMERAKAMGFDVDTTYYHGSPDSRGLWKDGFSKKGGIGLGQDRPLFFSKDRWLASTYADDSRSFDYQNSEPETIPVFLKMDKPKSIGWQGRVFRGKTASGERFALDDSIDSAKAEGHDGVVVTNIRDTYDTSGKAGNVTVVFEPNQIRSVNAAFDPDYSDSSNLMASLKASKSELKLKKIALSGGLFGFLNGEVSIVAQRQVEVTGSDLTTELPLGHEAHVEDGADVWLMEAFSEGELVATITAQVKGGKITAIHEINATTERAGAGEKIVASILADNNEIKIVEALDQSQEFWSKMGANNFFDQYKNTTINWSDYERNRQRRNEQGSNQGIEQSGSVQGASRKGTARANTSSPSSNRENEKALDQESVDWLNSFNDSGRYSLPDEDKAFRKIGLKAPERKKLSEVIESITIDTIKAAVSNVWDRSYEGVVDGLHGLKLAEARSNLGIAAGDYENSGYVAARLATGVADVMQAILSYGAPKWEGGVLVKAEDTRGLLAIFSDLGPELDNWLGWMAGNRAEELLAESREDNLDQEDINYLKQLNVGNESLFENAKKEYNKLNSAMLNLAEDSGLINPDSRASWESEWYVPFYRQDETDGYLTAPKSRRGLSHQTAGIKRLRGGDMPTNDLMENILTNWLKLADSSMKNMALMKAVDGLVDTDYVSNESMKYTQAIVPRNQVNYFVKRDPEYLDMMASMLGLEEPSGQSGLDLGLDSIETKRQIVLEELKGLDNDGFEKLWAISAPKDPDVVRIQRGGKNEYYKIHDPMLLRSLVHVGGVGSDNPLMRSGRWFKRLLTTGVTSSPDFILRNFIRDAAHAWAINPDGFKFGVDSWKGLVKAYEEDEDYREIMFSGASFQGGYVHGTDPEKGQQIIRRALEKQGYTSREINSHLDSVIDTAEKSKNMLLTSWQHYRTFSDKVENSNRLATFKAAKAAGKPLAQAVFEAKDLMDYSMRGNHAAAILLTDLVPFLNARIQGLSRLGRSIKDHPKEVTTALAKIALVSVLLAMINGDDERYKELADWEKDAYWHVFFGEHHVRVPKPFEIGLLAGTMPERMYHSWVADTQPNEKVLWALTHGTFETLSFNPIPQAVLPLIELWGNESWYFETPIESMSDQRKLPSHRFGARTSDTMKAIGANFDLSPKQLEHLWKGYTGTMGGYALSAADSLYRITNSVPEKGELLAKDIPVVKSFYRGTTPNYATQYQTDMYNRLKEVNQIVTTLKNLRDEGEAEELYNESAEKLEYANMLKDYAKEVGDMRRDIRAITEDTELKPKQKQLMINKIQKQMNLLTREAAVTSEGAF